MEPTNTNTAEHLERWLELQRTRLQPATWQEYAGTVRRYLGPHLGAKPLGAVTHHDLTGLYHTLLTAGGIRGRPLSLTTVRRVAAVAHKAFADAVRTDLVPDNPCDKATLPRVDVRGEHRELKVWTAPQLATFLEGERRRPLWPLWVVAAGTGMRRGELLGLRWVDVDVPARTLHVRRALSLVTGTTRLKVPKTNQARSLHVGPAVLEALRLRRDQQQRQPPPAPPLAPPPPSAEWGLVFTEPDGGHICPQKVTDTWREAVRDSRLPKIRFHDVRHSHASLLLEAGVSPQIVSARLGHANIQTTLDIYAEVLPAMDEDAAAAFEDHVWGAAPSGPQPAGSGAGTRHEDPPTAPRFVEVPAPPTA